MSNSPLEAESSLLVDRVQVGMVVLDAIGTETGTVTVVQPPGTRVRPDTVAGVAEILMGSGYLRIDGSGFLSNDVYAGGDQIAAVAADDPPLVELRVARDELHRATA
jgi:hypothetical protein